MNDLAALALALEDARINLVRPQLELDSQPLQ